MIREQIKKIPWLHNLARIVKHSITPIKSDSTWTTAPILKEYVTTLPSAQNAVDIFQGEWWSVLPDEKGKLNSGNTHLFEDDRILWLIQKLGGVNGKKILELGPLEAGHTFLLERSGAASVTAIEANTRAYLKCLIVKEIFDLKVSRFLCGDFEEYLRNSNENFDICIACGVLYHLRNPVELIYRMSLITDVVFIWTHFFSKSEVMKIPHIGPKMSGESKSNFNGFEHTLYKYNYQEFLNTTRFAGGTESFSCWLNKEDLLNALKFFGYKNISIGREQRAHVNGPCIELIASKHPF